LGVPALAPRRELLHRPLDRVVDREQGLEPALVAGLDLRDQTEAEAGDGADPARLVADVLLVEARIDGEGRGGERARVARGGISGIVWGEELDLHVERGA